MYDSVLKLVSETFTKDADTGIMTKAETERQVFAKVSSVTQTEFTSAGTLGLSPAYKFTMPLSSYQNERILLFMGERFAIYRTFIKKGEIEVYTERQAGVSLA